jgi:hypothetical protein
VVVFYGFFLVDCLCRGCMFQLTVFVCQNAACSTLLLKTCQEMWTKKYEIDPANAHRTLFREFFAQKIINTSVPSFGWFTTNYRAGILYLINDIILGPRLSFKGIGHKMRGNGIARWSGYFLRCIRPIGWIVFRTAC